ncbi:MAG: glycosyltransferase, partial [Methanosarcina sp.]|nr:glycosyltransferase [Methanosarcina sp.]
AGDADHDMPYTRQLRKLAEENNVVLPGFVRGEALHQLLTHARLFVLPSFHEGLPISLLEAMSYKLPVIVSDIPANKQIALPDEAYFSTGNVELLRIGLDRKLKNSFQPVEYDMTPYDWDKIAIQTEEVYKKAIKNR